MAQKITRKNLDNLCVHLNTIAKNCGIHAEYYIEGAYGGVSLYDAANGHRNVLNHGYVPKGILYDLIHAYIDGILATQDIVNVENENG